MESTCTAIACPKKLACVGWESRAGRGLEAIQCFLFVVRFQIGFSPIERTTNTDATVMHAAFCMRVFQALDCAAWWMSWQCGREKLLALGAWLGKNSGDGTCAVFSRAWACRNVKVGRYKLLLSTKATSGLSIRQMARPRQEGGISAQTVSPTVSAPSACPCHLSDIFISLWCSPGLSSKRAN